MERFTSTECVIVGVCVFFLAKLNFSSGGRGRLPFERTGSRWDREVPIRAHRHIIFWMFRMARAGGSTVKRLPVTIRHISVTILSQASVECEYRSPTHPTQRASGPDTLEADGSEPASASAKVKE